VDRRGHHQPFRCRRISRPNPGCSRTSEEVPLPLVVFDTYRLGYQRVLQGRTRSTSGRTAPYRREGSVISRDLLRCPGARSRHSRGVLVPGVRMVQPMVITIGDRVHPAVHARAAANTVSGRQSEFSGPRMLASSRMSKQLNATGQSPWPSTLAVYSRWICLVRMISWTLPSTAGCLTMRVRGSARESGSCEFGHVRTLLLGGICASLGRRGQVIRKDGGRWNASGRLSSNRGGRSVYFSSV